MRKQIDISATIELEYEADSNEFQNSYEDYVNYVDAVATEVDMIKKVAWSIAKYGTDKIIECIGLVSVNGKKPESNWCGINVITNSCDTANNTLEFDINLHD